MKLYTTNPRTSMKRHDYRRTRRGAGIGSDTDWSNTP